ncbi:lysR family regulatory protein [Colletotrichum tofieldiae]|nr:LysR family regulatory protein [Colletotrichum tofieldiae]GKT69003.1 lysR family regulatory protein [Colletotrichum tofieldiae]
MFGIFSSTPQAPPCVPTDRVIPVGYFDDTVVFRTFVMYTMFVFPEVLDTEKLRTSLEDVVRRPDWDKLSARLRRNDRGELEHRIPRTFSKERPAISYDHVDCSDTMIGNHPAGSRIPGPPSDGRPAVVGNPDELLDLIHGPDTPKVLNDYLYTDRSELGLRIVSFKNATVIVLHWIHLAFDAIAKKSLLEAWSLALKGKRDEIAKPLPLDAYALKDLGKSPTTPHVLADRRMSVFGIAWWVLRNVYRLAFRSKEHRMVCVPAEFLAKLKEKAMKELGEEATASTKAIPFLSEGDVLVAWVTRLSLSTLSEDSKRLAYQWRPVLTDLVPPGRPFLCNCVGFLVTLLTASDIMKKPLSYLASEIRRSIAEQGTREQVEAYSSLIRKDLRNKSPPLFGDGSMQLLMFSNWHKANIYGFDVSAAAIEPRDTPLLPSYVQTVQGPYNFTDGIIILGKDTHGNYWLSGHKVRGDWGAMMRKMAEDS